MNAKVLLVDDFMPFRHYVRGILENHQVFQVVAEAADGLTAVQRAEELRPEIILLDIAMPWLNGLEAARQIIHVSPNSRIIFLTEHNSLQMVRHALEIGARGYLIKSTAGIELLRALEAVFLGDVYIGRGVALPDLPGSD